MAMIATDPVGAHQPPAPHDRQPTAAVLGYDPPSVTEFSAIDLATVVVRHWRLTVVLPLAAAVAALGASFVAPARYTAVVTFVPDTRAAARLPAGLAGLAGQFGVSLNTDPSQSPKFYAQVVHSRELLERVLRARYQWPGHPTADSATLLSILGINGDGLADSVYRGVRKLRRRLAARVDNQTSIVTLSIEAPDPILAAAVAQRMLGYLEEFNADKRQSRARERRVFIEERLVDGERQLRAAEDQLKRFYELNRSWQQAPQLVFEEGRLRRQVDIRQELYLTLSREHEMARIEEVNDTPVLTVIDPPVPPQRRSWPRRGIVAILALLAGGGIGIIGAFWQDHLQRMRREQNRQYLEFRGLLQRFRSGIGRLLGRPASRASD